MAAPAQTREVTFSVTNGSSYFSSDNTSRFGNSTVTRFAGGDRLFVELTQMGVAPETLSRGWVFNSSHQPTSEVVFKNKDQPFRGDAQPLTVLSGATSFVAQLFFVPAGTQRADVEAAKLPLGEAIEFKDFPEAGAEGLPGDSRRNYPEMPVSHVQFTLIQKPKAEAAGEATSRAATFDPKVGGFEVKAELYPARTACGAVRDTLEDGADRVVDVAFRTPAFLGRQATRAAGAVSAMLPRRPAGEKDKEE